MRPLELHVRNFRSFAGESTFDFTGRRLVGIVGPIGAGKSSILDAIAYGLYARTPRVASAVRDLIHQRSDTAIVRLTFDVDGETWQVTRSIRKSQSTHTLQQLDDDGGALATITQKSDVNARIEQLIGLDFDGFSRSVLLAQGKFAEFLTAQPAQRDRVLKGVFGHERIDEMRAIARERSRELSLEIEKLAGKLEALTIAERRLEEQRTERSAVAERLEALEKIQPRVNDCDERIDAIGKRTEVIDARTDAIAVQLDAMPDSAATERILGEVERTRVRRSELAAALEEQQALVGDAEDTATVLAERTAVLDQAADLLVQLGALTTKLDERRKRLATAENASKDLASALDKARAAAAAAREVADVAGMTLEASTLVVGEARAALDQARHDNMAHTLRGELASGEACPVCAQEVASVPTVGVVADIEAAERSLADATESDREARSAAQRTTAEAAAAQAAVEGLEAQQARSGDELTALTNDVADGEKELAAQQSSLIEVLGAGDPAELVRKGRSEIAEARNKVDVARKAVERVRTEHDQAIRDEQTAGKQLAEMRMSLARVASSLGAEFATDSDDVADMEQAVDRLRTSLSDEAKQLGDEQLALQKELTEVKTSRRDLLADHELTRDLATEITTLTATVDTLAKQIAAVEKDLAAQSDDRDRLGALEAKRGNFDRIVSDLTDAKFVRYLLDDERVRLAALASEHFQRLSSGRYRFSEDGVFAIIDLATADVVRKADSLSGGETFLASLALALGLAEMVARSGGRLEAFFLDEGFGTLDPEHLHLAMEGIERLVTDESSRLVVVVSHVPELRQRLEDLIELDKDALTGDTVVVRA